jgi:hypothetical protein
MRTFAVDNCEFEVATKRCGIYRVPFQHGGITHHRLINRFDLNQPALAIKTAIAARRSTTTKQIAGISFHHCRPPVI